VRGWRGKLVFTLIAYSAGFATAIYTLAPGPENKKHSADSPSKSSRFVESVNSGMHKAADLGKEAASRTAEFIKEKIEEERRGAKS
jgi:hypothetical protein